MVTGMTICGVVSITLKPTIMIITLITLTKVVGLLEMATSEYGLIFKKQSNF
jgi:hypothetical protein